MQTKLPPRDVNMQVEHIVDITTDEAHSIEPPKKNPLLRNTLYTFRRGAQSLWNASLVLLMLGATISPACTFLRYPYIDRELSGPITLKLDWLEFTPKEPLKAERNTQEVTLFPDPPIQMVDDPIGKASLVPSDGRSADIEAELIDTNGKIYRSRPGLSERMTGNLKVTSRSLNFKDLPHDVTYKTVRIRSSAPYPVKGMLWRCYNWSSVHQ
jgi:hypothetical protein